MSTFYGYVKQDVDNQVNWGEVGKTFSDMLTAENTRRDTLKKEIDDNTRTDLETLSKIPRGGSEQANRWMSTATDSITKQRLMYENALKSGNMDLKDYNNVTANIRSGVKNMETTIKSFNQWYDEGMKRAQGNESQAAELWKDSLLESMKFKDTTPNIALDGTMSVTKQVKNPKTGLMEVSSNPADTFSFSSMLDFGKTKFDRFKADEKLNELAKVAGEYVKVYGQGRIETISDIFQKDAKGNFINKSGVDALSTSIDGMLSNDVNKMSILTDYLPANPKTGKPFEFTLDANDPRLKGKERDGIILMDNSNGLSPILTESQKKMAHDAMMQGLQARLGREEKFREPPAPREPRQESEGDRARKDKDETNLGLFNDIKILSTGTPEQFQAVANDRAEDANRFYKENDIDTQIGLVERTPTQFLIHITENGKKRVQPIPRTKDIENPSRALMRYLTNYRGSWDELKRLDKGEMYKDKPNLSKAAAGSSFREKNDVSSSRLPTGKKGVMFSDAFNEQENSAGSMADIGQQFLTAALKGVRTDKIQVSRGSDDKTILIKIGKNNPVITYDYSNQDKAKFVSFLEEQANRQIDAWNKYNVSREKKITSSKTQGELD